MELKDLMSQDVCGIDRHEPIRRAAETMACCDVGAVPVFDDGHVVGILTDRDIAVRAVAAGCDCEATPCGELMSPDPLILPGNTDVAEAAAEMERRQVRRVLVQGPDEAVVGIVSLGDLATQCGDRKTCAELVEAVSRPKKATPA